jgi:hypothetical protein
MLGATQSQAIPDVQVAAVDLSLFDQLFSEREVLQ